MQSAVVVKVIFFVVVTFNYNGCNESNYYCNCTISSNVMVIIFYCKSALPTLV